MRSVPPICRHSSLYSSGKFSSVICLVGASVSAILFLSLWTSGLHIRIPGFGLQISGLFRHASELSIELWAISSIRPKHLLHIPLTCRTCSFLKVFALATPSARNGFFLLDLPCSASAFGLILAQKSPSQIYLSCYLGQIPYSAHQLGSFSPSYSHCS